MTDASFKIVQRDGYIAVMLRKSDMYEIEIIKDAYGIPRPDIVRSFLTTLLKTVDETGSMPAVQYTDADALPSIKSLVRFNFGPTEEQLTRLKELSIDLGIAIAHLIVFAVRIGIQSYKNGTFRLERVYVNGRSRQN